MSIKQSAAAVDGQAACPGIFQPHVRWTGARPYRELVLQRAAKVGEVKVDPGPEIAIGDLRVAGDAGAPSRRVAAPQVVDVAGGPVQAPRLGPSRAAGESQRERHAGLSRCVQKGQHGPLARQVERVAPALRVVANVAVNLSAVLDEGRRQCRVGAERTGRLDGRCRTRRCLRRGADEHERGSESGEDWSNGREELIEHSVSGTGRHEQSGRQPSRRQEGR